MLTVDDLQKLAVGIDDAPHIGRLPVNIHLKRVMFDVRHVFGELLLHDTVLVVFRDKEQVSDILPIQPVVEQMGTLINVFVNEFCEILHILVRTVIRLDNGESPFFKLLDVIVVIPFDVMQIFELIPHQIIGLFELLHQYGSQLT